MPFEKFKLSVEKLYDTVKNSESLASAQAFVAEAGASIDDKLKSISQSISEPTAIDRPASDGSPEDDTTYESLTALKPVQKLLSEAGAAIDEKTRTLLDGEVSELLGAAGGVVGGVVAGAGILSVGAASGTAGAAALTSGLATAGAIVGGGMVVGIGVVAAPAVVMTAAGVWAVGRHNRNKLFEAKEAILQEALRKRDALLSELHATNSSNHERIDYLSRLVAQLQGAVENLQSDIAQEKPCTDTENRKNGEAE